MYKDSHSDSRPDNRDFGPAPYVADIDMLCRENRNFRTALWTGGYLQMTLMSIPVGGEVGLEVHRGNDQYLHVVGGSALVMMGAGKDELDYRVKARSGYGILVPVNTWHNIVNNGSNPLKLISVYAPPQHPHGVVQVTKADADAEEKEQPDQGIGFWYHP